MYKHPRRITLTPGDDSIVIVVPTVDRVTVVGPDGIAFEKHGLFEHGAEIHLQDDGKTLKIFPRHA